VSRNGQRRPRRPRIGLITPAPSDEEAAAITAAIERFLTETAPPPAPLAGAPSPWQRAAIREGVEARAGFGFAWGEPGRAG
jgi:hypothetical protein